MIKLIQSYFKIVSKSCPKLAANQAFNLFCTVRKKSIRKREIPFYNTAKKHKISFGDGSLDCYHYGVPTKNIVLLVHGWDSNVGCLLKFASELTKRGKYVIGFNLPAHAFSKQKKTHVFECKNAFKTIVNSLPEYTSLSIISHSFGSAVTAYGLSELNVKIDTLVFQTSPNYLKDIFLEFKNMISLSDKSYILIIKKANKILQENIDEIATEKKLLQINFNHLYLFHDKNDKVIPFSNSEKIHKAIANSTLFPYENVGHYRMLWNTKIVAKTVKLLTN